MYKAIPMRERNTNQLFYPRNRLNEKNLKRVVVCCQLKSYHTRPLALLLLPGLLGPPLPAFIFFAEKLRRSPLETASPLFAWRFFPPKPNFSFFFWRFCDGASERPRLRSAGCFAVASSMATSKRSLASSVGPDESDLRSVQIPH